MSAPTFPGKRYIEWDLPDPKGRPLDEVRAIRDDIACRIDLLLAAETNVPGSAPNSRQS
jgi:arsenate reductase (thioredoxin)